MVDSGWIHLHWPNATFYWVTLAAWLLNGLLSLVRLKRLKEVHHLYIGAVLALVPWWPLRIAAYLIVVDDSIQHAVEVTKLPAIMPDWSPLHKLGVWFLTLVGYRGS